MMRSSNSMKFVVAVLALGMLSACASTATEDDARMAAGHAHDTPAASPAATTEPVQPVIGATVVYATVDGKAVNGYLAKPRNAKPGLPGLIVIHEWWGLNDNVREETERLAAEGYVALAVDLYGGQSATEVPAAMKLSQALSANTPPAEDNLRQAYAFLAGEQGALRIGSIGWCLGGRWSLRSALLLPKDIDATVIFYGSVNVPEAALEPLAMPILGLFGTKDPVIPLPTVVAFEASLKKLGKKAEIHIYEGAQHGFANPSSGTAYEPVAAEDAWRRATAFLHTHLQAP